MYNGFFNFSSTAFYDSVGRQLKRLFIGQSFLVVLCSFLIAQLTSFPGFILEGFGVLDGNRYLQGFFASGFPGTVYLLLYNPLSTSM